MNEYRVFSIKKKTGQREMTPGQWKMTTGDEGNGGGDQGWNQTRSGEQRNVC